jgi:hypothetical protein
VRSHGFAVVGPPGTHARWELTTDDAPFVHLASGRFLDVIESADARKRHGDPRLMRVYFEAVE